MTNEKPISVILDKCIGCSLCVEDCPSNYLFISNSKATTREKGCIECGHCFAICPQNAIVMNNFDTKDCTDVVPVSGIDSDFLLHAMRSRRTIRQFKKDRVEPEKIEKILEAGRYCPTGGNMQNVSYTLLGNKQNDIEKESVRVIKKTQKILSPFLGAYGKINVGQGFFFKGAPLVIVVSSKSSVNAGLASSYMELMAESMDLGVLYSGFFVMCAKISPKIRKMLELPKGHKVVSCMVIGYPSVKYKRTVPRKPLQFKKL